MRRIVGGVFQSLDGVVQGAGRPTGTMKLVDQTLSPGGAAIATCEPAGPVQQGSFGQIDSAPEHERQRKMREGS